MNVQRQREWKRRIDQAEERREPVHVTPEEWRELKDAQAERDIELLRSRGFVETEEEQRFARFLGTPVVVDWPLECAEGD